MPEIPAPLAGQQRFVAPLEETPLEETGTLDTSRPPEGRWHEAWASLRKNPTFWVSAFILFCLLFISLFPGLLTQYGTRESNLSINWEGPQSGHWFGLDGQGYDVYTRVIYGARASILVGVTATAAATLIGLVVGALAGFYGGWLDEVISRLADVVFAIPLLLGAIVALSALRNQFPGLGYWGGIFAVSSVLAAFGWPQVARIARGAVLQIKNLEYVDASRAIGSTRWRNLWQHVVPNSLAPIIVITTVSLGVFIVAEATLSFLGIGLPPNVTSWGYDINQATSRIRSGQAMHALFFPSGALFITVLSFMLLGDALREALDPKGRNR